MILGGLDHRTCNIRAKRENWEEIKRELAIKRELLGRTNRQTQIVTPCQLLPWRIAVLQGYEPGSYRYWILPRVFGHHHHCLERLCKAEEEHWKTSGRVAVTSEASLAGSRPGRRERTQAH